MARVLPPPPPESLPDPAARGLVEAIWAYATASDGEDLSEAQRAVGMHHVAVAAERAFNVTLAQARGAAVPWSELCRAHGMALSSLQRRVDRADHGDIPPRSPDRRSQ